MVPKLNTEIGLYAPRVQEPTGIPEILRERNTLTKETREEIRNDLDVIEKLKGA